jgi:hypothetical protein
MRFFSVDNRMVYVYGIRYFHVLTSKKRLVRALDQDTSLSGRTCAACSFLGTITLANTRQLPPKVVNQQLSRVRVELPHTTSRAQTEEQSTPL